MFAVPQGPVQLNCNGQLLGSEPLPIKLTAVPFELDPVAVWLELALMVAVGMVCDAAAKASIRPNPNTALGAEFNPAALAVRRLLRIVRPSEGVRAPAVPARKHGEVCSSKAATPAAWGEAA